MDLTSGSFDDGERSVYRGSFSANPASNPR
jgi:hypothetical protein